MIVASDKEEMDAMKRKPMFLIMAVVIIVAIVACFFIFRPVKGEKGMYYLFDDSIIESADNAALTLGTVEKVITNASWVDQYKWTPESGIPDWEQRVTIMYPNVEYDEAQGKYKMWYQAYHTDSPVDEYDWRSNIIDKNNTKNVELGTFENTAKGTVYDGIDVLCYMESTDGINWVRPELGEFYYKTRTGEIIGTNIAFIGMTGLGVLQNENPDENEPKYLMAGRAFEVDSYDANGDPIGVAISWSEDGYHWEAPITIKSAYECPSDMYYVRADTHNQLLWSAERGKYVVITRGYTNSSPSVRVVAYMEGLENLTSLKILQEEKNTLGDGYWKTTTKYWSKPETVLDRYVTQDAQPYSMPILHASDGYYIGVVSVANFDKKTSGVWNSVHAQLAWSSDGKDWQYIEKGTSFIPNAEEFVLEKGNDYGMIYCAAPVTVGDKTRIFYAAVPELHYTNYSQIPEDIKQVVDEQIPAAKEAQSFTRTPTLNIAQFGKDRYAGYSAESGTVTTGPFKVWGENFKLTADVKEGGALRVEVLDKKGKVIKGFEAESCVPIEGDVTDQVVIWKDKDFSDLKGKTVSFRIYLQNASVYTISGDFEKK